MKKVRRRLEHWGDNANSRKQLSEKILVEANLFLLIIFYNEMIH